MVSPCRSSLMRRAARNSLRKLRLMKLFCTAAMTPQNGQRMRERERESGTEIDTETERRRDEEREGHGRNTDRESETE